MLISERIKQIVRPIYHKPKETLQKEDLNPRWIELQKKLSESEKIIDLGCGNNPVQGATFGVDLYVEPIERSFGSGATINSQNMKKRGVTFINARLDYILPFYNKEFDFAYSHHSFEHLDDPAIACKEMMRIAKSGVIIAPSILAEQIFGRPYHKWLVMERGNTIFFFKKRSFEDRPFGEHPKWNAKKKRWLIENNTNPFDILLNDERWYQGSEKMPRLSNILRKYWYSHSFALEVIFIWDESFDYKIYE